MKYTLKKAFEKILLYCRNNIVTNINDEFTKFTGFTKEEIIGKSLIEISCILRIDSQVHPGNVDSEYDCYMFTKEYEPREVTISCMLSSSEYEKIYSFKEKPNSRIEDKNMYFQQLCNDNQVGAAVYSFPDLILLKDNEKHLGFLEYPYNKKENSIGKSLKETLTGYVNSNAEKRFLDIIQTGNSYYLKEVKYDRLKRGVTYWDISLVPIKIKGKIKYLVQTITDVTEKVENRMLAEEKTKQLESILESMYDGVYVVDKDLNITESNIRLRKLVYDYDSFKKVSDALNTIKLYDFEGNLITSDSMPVRRVFMGKKVEDLRLTAIRPDGVFNFSYNGSPIFDKNGNVEKAVISVRNITENVKKDQIIKKQNGMLNAIIENITDSLIIIDENGQYTMVNKTFKDNFSISAIEPITPEILMKKVECYDVHGNRLLLQNLPSRRVSRGESFSEYRIDYKFKDGHVDTFEVNGAPIYDSEGNFIAGVLVSRNINERLKNEETKLMLAKYDILNRTIENLNLNYTLFSYPDAKIKYINRKAFNYLRKINPKLESIDSCIGMDSFEIYMRNMNEKVEIESKLKEVIANNGGSFIFNRKISIAGKESFHKFIFQPLYNFDKNVTEIVVIGIDMTEELEAKSKMEKALKLQDEILTNIAHELKTPLNLIYSTNQLMEMYLKNGSIEEYREKLGHSANIIKQNCFRFMRLINNIIDTSKIKSGFLNLSLSNENIVEVVENIVQSISEYIKGKGINIIFDTDIEEKIIACDTNKIERIMLNLISNAVKFSNTEKNIYVGVSDKNNTVEISVRDSGIGIDKKYLNKIFDRFYQVDKSLSRNAEGSGIGLALVKSLVEIHGGKISVDSEVDKGTTFKIELPVGTIAEDEIACDKIITIDNKIEMINMEFSDIYSI